MKLLLLLLVGLWFPQEGKVTRQSGTFEAPPPDPSLVPEVDPNSPPLRLHIAPLPELWFEVRALGEGPQDAVPLPLRESVQRMKELSDALGSSIGFGGIEGWLSVRATSEELLAALDGLPEDAALPSRTGQIRPVDMRTPALAVARALVKAEPAWREQVWPARKQALEAKQAELLEAFPVERQRELFGYLEQRLDLKSVNFGAKIYLTSIAPRPGGVTHRSPKGPVSFVATRGRSDSLLCEVFVHEALHSFDAASPGSLFTILRRRLGSEKTERNRSAAGVHLLFFVAAADGVKRYIDEQHVDYGESQGAYARMGPVEPLRGPYLKFLAGEIDTAELEQSVLSGLQF